LRQVERLLIVKLSSIGDVVHALPVSAALGRAFPHLEITWLVEERSAPVVLGNPYLKDVMVLPDDWHDPLRAGVLKRWRDLARRLRERRFEVALDLQGLTRSAALVWASGARWRFGCDWLRELAPLLVQRVRRRRKSVHIVDQLLDVVRFLGAVPTGVHFPLHLSPADRAAADRLLEEAGLPRSEPFIVLNPTTGATPHKGLGAGRVVDLVDQLQSDIGLAVLLVGAANDRALAETILSQARIRPFSLVGRTTLRELMAVLHRAALHIAGDTGSGHLAAALDTPVVSIYGRTDPARSAPHGQERWALHHPERCAFLCRAYRAVARVNRVNVCFRPPPSCLAAVTPAEIVATVRRCLAAQPRTSAAPVPP
jgi:heptosyltransferase-1